MTKVRHFVGNTLTILLILTAPYMLWRTLSYLTHCSHPIVVVISESMAPAFHRGDILFLSNRQSQIHAGDIPVVWFPGNPLPMVHRAIQSLLVVNRYVSSVFRLPASPFVWNLY